MNEPKIVNQQIKWTEEDNSCLLVTKFDNGALAVDPLTPEEAAQWTSERKF